MNKTQKVMVIVGIILTLITLSVAYVSAEQTLTTLGTFKQNSDVVLIQSCANCTYVNITSIIYPNLSTAISNVATTKNNIVYSYTLSGNYTKDFGRYIACGYGNPDGITTSWCYDFYINGTGRADPSGSVLTFFIIAFLVIIGFLCYLVIYSFGHALRKDFDIIDLAFDFGIYFVLVSFYILQNQYLGSPVMSSILYVLVIVGVFTHVLASLIYFTISMVYQGMLKNKQDLGIKV